MLPVLIRGHALEVDRKRFRQWGRNSRFSGRALHLLQHIGEIAKVAGWAKSAIESLVNRARLPELSLSAGLSVREVYSEDDNLEAVFKYLVNK